MWPGAGAPVVLGPAPGVPRVLHCALHRVLCCALHCVPHCVWRCVLHCVLRCVLYCVLHCVLRLHCVLCCVPHPVVHCVPYLLCCALHYVLCCVLHCVLHCALCCVLNPVVLCVLHPVVHCALHPVVHYVLHPVVYCVPCSVLAGHVHCRGAVRYALHAVLVMHPGAVHRLPFPVALHPALPDLPALPALWGGGGGSGPQWGRGRLPPCASRAAEMLQKTSCSPSAAVPCGEGGGGSSVTAGRGGLALRARRDAGTTSRSGEGACRASRRGSNLRARCEGLSGAGSAADAGLARPSHAESALAPAWRAAGASTCRPGARRCWGGACPGAVCPSCPANIPKMAKKCINCISARPTPPHTNPMESGPGNTFSAQNRKKPKDS